MLMLHSNQPLKDHQVRQKNRMTDQLGDAVKHLSAGKDARDVPLVTAFVTSGFARQSIAVSERALVAKAATSGTDRAEYCG